MCNYDNSELESAFYPFSMSLVEIILKQHAFVYFFEETLLSIML